MHDGNQWNLFFTVFNGQTISPTVGALQSHWAIFEQKSIQNIFIPTDFAQKFKSLLKRHTWDSKNGQDKFKNIFPSTFDSIKEYFKFDRLMLPKNY